MGAQRLLVVVFSDVETADLESAIRRRADPDAEVRLVAPPELSRFRWLFMDVDRGRERAHARVAEAARALDADLSVHVEPLEPAHPNPRQAVEDALRTFPADEVIIVTHPKEEASWQEQEAFGGLDELDVPVRVLPLAGVHGS